MNVQKDKRWITTYGIITLLLFAIYNAFGLEFFTPWSEHIPFAQNLIKSLLLISLIMLTSKILSKAVNTQTRLEGDRYNLLRIIRFLSLVFSLLIIVSFLFKSLYAAALSVGLFSLVVGFALQAPITSFIAWVYLIFRRSYLVGDRIQIKGLRGDVVEINYLDTSLLECSGDYLVNDRSSGRIIRFPNSLILREEVINYSGPDVPFIWNETPLQVAFTSDLQFVKECLLDASRRDFRERYPQLDSEKQAKWESAVYFRINTYAWLEAVVSYPVEPQDTTGRRNRILTYALPKLNEAPDRVKFPEGVLR